jgi:hypothetical protein
MLDLLLVYAIAGTVFPHVKSEITSFLPGSLHDFAMPVFFIVLLPLSWFVTDVIAGGYSPGRVALGLGMSDSAGRHLSLARRSTRFMGKLFCFGLTGLRFGGLSHYDRLVGTVWRCPLAPPALADLRLVFLNGKYKDRGGSLGSLPGYEPDKPVRLGRDPGWSQIKFDDPTISARHCELAFRDGVPMIRDLGSTHGTFVNGRRIASHTWVALADAREFALARQRIALRA